MTQPAVTACNCTGEPRPILDEAGQPLLVEGDAEQFNRAEHDAFMRNL